jgi:hypothetical protein
MPNRFIVIIPTPIVFFGVEATYKYCYLKWVGGVYSPVKRILSYINTIRTNWCIYIYFVSLTLALVVMR